MGTQTRLSSAMSSSTEGLPFDPTIRIPPIQDPSPLQVVSGHRPSPLEPSAAEGRRPTAVRLTSRSKALANARPISRGSPIKPLDTRHLAASNEDERQIVPPRKRQKVEYVQLPQPHKRGSSDHVSSLDHLPRLNQLNEPPPSAARFPPITTNGTSPVLQKPEPQQKEDNSTKSAETNANASKTKCGNNETVLDDVTKKPKRVYTRGRRNWTEEETENLLRGVAKYGVGKWKRIMGDPEFRFPTDRTAVDLKDRYRTCKMHEERRIERDAKGEPYPDTSAPSRRSSKTSKAQAPVPVTENSELREVANYDHKAGPQTPKSEVAFAEINTAKDIARTLDSPSKESKRWTTEEDANLSKGFQKYGFSWTSITKDKDLHLQHRTGTQLRDRFRIKFPIHYQSSVPVELPDPVTRKTKKRRRPVDPKAPRGGIKVVLASPDDMRAKQISSAQPTPTEQRSKTLTIADMTGIVEQGQAATKLLLPSMSSLCARVDAQPLPDVVQYPIIDIQPLPDSDDEFDDSDYEDFTSEPGMNDNENELPDISESDDGDMRSNHDVRHLSISGLLNETQEDVLRLPPFRSAYDDSNDILDQGGVQLPPLAFWDDLAPRPMFDLD